jgi:integrase
MPLTDITIRRAKSGTKPFKLSDARGLYLLVKPHGGKWWRFDYRYDSKRKTLSLGTYPDVGLKLARERRDDYRRLLAQGVDPSENRKAAKAARAEALGNSFEVVAREWFAKHAPHWAPSHSDKIIQRLERDVFPWIGARPVAEIEAPELLAIVRRIEARGSIETAHRALQNCGQVFRYAIATQRAVRAPSLDLRGALSPTRRKHFAAITDPKEVGELLRAIDGYKGHYVTRCALQLAPLVFVRPGELRKAEWADIDVDAVEWRYTITKTNTQRIVPLCRQAVGLLRELYPLTGRGRYVFPSARSAARPMSENAILAAMRRMGIGKDEMSVHGFRAMARTILDEVLGFRQDYIEHQLAHTVRDPNGRAYNRTVHLAERRAMMQQWADYLDKLREGADVIQLHGQAV